MAKNKCDYVNGTMIIVDGKQCLNSVSIFVNNVFPLYLKEYKDPIFYKDFSPRYGSEFIMVVNSLENYTDVIRWYLELNSGGVLHTQKN